MISCAHWIGAAALEKKKRKRSEFCWPILCFSAPADSSFLWDFSERVNGVRCFMSDLLSNAAQRTSLAMALDSRPEGSFVPALIVVDMQEDFCPPVSLENRGR